MSLAIKEDKATHARDLQRSRCHCGAASLSTLERCAAEKSAEDNRVHLHMPAWAVVARSCQPLAKGLPDTAVLSNTLCETATGIDVNV